MRRRNAQRFPRQKSLPTEVGELRKDGPGEKLIEFNKLFNSTAVETRKRHFGGHSESEREIGRLGGEITILASNFAAILTAMSGDCEPKTAITKIDDSVTKDKRIFSRLKSRYLRELIDLARETRERMEITEEDNTMAEAVEKIRGVMFAHRTLGTLIRNRDGRDDRDAIECEKELKYAMDPKNRKSLENYTVRMACNFVESMEIFTDPQVIQEVNSFFDSFLTIMKSFDKYENKKAQCFMVVCRSRITENIIKITGEFLLSVKNINEMGREMAHFPLMWVIEPESLERLGRLIKSITSNRIINAIMQNPQWVENDRNFAKLAELVAELEKSAKAGILSDTLVEAIGELDIDRSIALARRINERPEYLEVYTKFGVKARKLRMTSVEFYEYVMDVADQQVSQTETFHSVFQRAFAGRTDQIPIRVCRSAALIYLAGILPELATITESSEKDNEKLVDQIMEAVENGEFEIASRILNQRKIEMQARAEMAALERVMRFYPQATNEQVAAFLPLFKRLEVFGLTKKFTGLRKHGYEQARIIAEKTALLNDGALVTIFKSVPARALFVELALKIGGEETYERVNAIACEGSNGESELGMLRYMRAVVDQEKTAVTKESRRIVLVGGNNELDEIAHRLSEKTGLEVFPVTPSDATMSYLGRLITKNDIIIFITSSVKHASFRNVNAVANRKGISPINTARTNPDAILREIGHLMGEVLEARSVA